MGASKKELHDLLEDSLVTLRLLANEYHGEMNDADLLRVLAIITEIERTV